MITEKEPQRTCLILFMMALTPKLITVGVIEFAYLILRNRDAGSGLIWLLAPTLGALWAILLRWSWRDRIILMLVAFPPLVIWTGFSVLWHVCHRFVQCL